MQMLPLRACCSRLCAMPVQHLRDPEQAHEPISPTRIIVASKSPIGNISVATLIRTDITLDHREKAVKV